MNSRKVWIPHSEKEEFAFPADSANVSLLLRAVYGCPSILIMDEATSSLDTESEALVQRAINEVVKAKTALVIAHRLSTVRHADKIVVLNRGTIEAEGTHDELIKCSVTYKKLCAVQLVQ